VQLELCVQDYFDDSQSEEVVNVGDTDARIATETWENWFEHWLEMLQSSLPPASTYEIALRLTDDKEIQKLNSQYRQQDKPTDVLAFAALEVDSPLPAFDSMPLYLGDIVVSIDTAKMQAKQQNHPLSTELAWLSAHGLLHLLGWDHPDDDSLSRMLEQQVILLKSVGISIDIQ
jgi:probable rRNA maturation factor